MEPVDELHNLTVLYLQWLDNEISKLKRTIAMYEGGTYKNGIEQRLEDQICQCGYKRGFHIIRRNTWGLNLLCPYSVFTGINGFKYGSQFRTLGGVFTYSVGFNND